MADLVFEDLADKAWTNPNDITLGFSRYLRDGKNKKFCYIGVYEVTNPAHEEFGHYAIAAWWLNTTQFRKNRASAIRRAQVLLAKMKGEYLSGKRNWWTSKVVEG